ncbi:unnamed protein product [Brassica oleracea]
MTKTLLAVVGAILSELPITPSRIMDTINKMPLREMSCSYGREGSLLRRSWLFKKCFLIFEPRSLATRMVVAGGWLAPGPVLASLLALAAYKLPEKRRGIRRRLRCSEPVLEVWGPYSKLKIFLVIFSKN